MFFSGNFIYNKRYSKDYGIFILNESDDILNRYGINYDDTKEITLTISYLNPNMEAEP